MLNTMAVLWDMDGVLVDTGDLHYESWKIALDDYDISFSREDFERTFGMNNRGVLQEALGERFTEDSLAKIAQHKEASFRSMLIGRLEPLPGALELLSDLKAHEVPQALCSSAPQANIEAILNELQVWEYFEEVLSAAEMPGKPDPAVFLKAAARLGVPPGRCVVLEDAIAGVEAARRGGMKCLAVTSTRPKEDLSGATLIEADLRGVNYESLRELLVD